MHCRGFYVLGLALVAAPVLFFTPYRAVAWWIWAIFVVAWIVPAGKVCDLSYTVATSTESFSEGQPVTALLCCQVWRPFGHSWVFDTWRRFFQMKVVLPELPFLSPDKHLMYVQCPHACFPMAGLLNFPLADREDVTGIPALSRIIPPQCSALAASDAMLILQVSRNLSQQLLLTSCCRSLSTSTILPGTGATQPVSPLHLARQAHLRL